MFVKLIILPLFTFLHCHCANILGIVPSASVSHQIAYINFWTELSLKGHNVTLLTTNPQMVPSLPNLTKIDLSIGYKYLNQNSQWSTPASHKNPIQFVTKMFNLLYEVTDIYLQLSDVQRLINDKNAHFDVVFVESIVPEFLIFGEHFNAPTILITSLDASASLQKTFQNDYHPVVYPETFFPYVGELSFVERLMSTISTWIIESIREQYWNIRKANLDKYFKNISQPIPDLIEKSKMLFIFTSPVLLYPRPLSPRTIVVGGGATIQKPKTLPKDIQQFLDSANNGAIYFSLGSNAKSENLDNNSINEIIEVLRGLEYSILWKFDNKAGKYNIPNNVLAASWIPQQDVLRHPNVKLFITQGGIQSLEEAIYFEKPMIGIPIFGDQFSNVKKMEQKGVLKIVPSKPSINSIELGRAIREVMSNKSYTENVKLLNQITMDRPMNAIEYGIWWTEYIIRHKGNVDHLTHKPAKSIKFYQYYLLDILAFLFVVALGSILIIYFAIRKLGKMLSRLFQARKIDHSKKD